MGALRLELRATTRATGAMMPEDGLEQIRATTRSSSARSAFRGVPDHVSLWGLLIPIRREFQQYVNLRPVRLMPGIPLAARRPQAGRHRLLVVRENNEGEYSSIGGRMFEGTDDEIVVQESDLHAARRRPHPALRLRAGDDAARRST